MGRVCAVRGVPTELQQILASLPAINAQNLAALEPTGDGPAGGGRLWDD